MTTPHAHHIVKSYDNELNRLTGEIVRMGDLAVAQLEGAISALTARDTKAATAVISGDAAIDALELEIGRDALQLLVARAPMARDLREVVAALRISSDIERIGDYASNVAKRSRILNQNDPVKLASSLPALADLAGELVSEVLAAYSHRDADRALLVWNRDEQLDDLYTGVFRELLTYMMEDPRTITPCTHLLFMAKNIERIGDHATNIAENIYFLVHGEAIPQTRRKGEGVYDTQAQ
ncbi:MAG: phosphate signaling complex protein PhoU [Dokdonella sp.]